MTAENFFRSFGYIPSGEWIGDNIVETNDPFVMPRVLDRPPCIVCGAPAGRAPSTIQRTSEKE